MTQRAWTGAELHKARCLRRRGFASKSIGLILGRTKGAVVGALWRAANGSK